MTIGLPPRVTSPESAAWAYWPSPEDAIDGVGYRVARLIGPDLELVAIGSPIATTTPKPPHTWLRYHDGQGRVFGAVTLPWPSFVTTDPTSCAAIASAVAALLREPSAHGANATTTSAPMAVDAVYRPGTITAFDSGLFVRATIIGRGRAVAAWGTAEPPHIITLDG
ncbi:hypothetical protein [Nocardia sp. NBC_01327]|uniref:hypothetical protein n=1 Tax=Nocardia sp. NBC_01327 TaxID=2903593 RepID=UPI002E14B6C8|nr:hypothetical protein OG326_29370 [Nocardia sp. NBC_01327]